MDRVHEVFRRACSPLDVAPVGHAGSGLPTGARPADDTVASSAAGIDPGMCHWRASQDGSTSAISTPAGCHRPGDGANAGVDTSGPKLFRSTQFRGVPARSTGRLPPVRVREESCYERAARHMASGRPRRLPISYPSPLAYFQAMIGLDARGSHQRPREHHTVIYAPVPPASSHLMPYFEKALPNPAYSRRPSRSSVSGGPLECG